MWCEQTICETGMIHFGGIILIKPLDLGQMLAYAIHCDSLCKRFGILQV